MYELKLVPFIFLNTAKKSPGFRRGFGFLRADRVRRLCWSTRLLGQRRLRFRCWLESRAPG